MNDNRRNPEPHEGIDLLPTCPRCGSMHSEYIRYCPECGCRMLPNERELSELRELAVNWSSLPVDEDGWPLAAAHIRQSYGAGYMAGLAKRLDAEPVDEVQEAGADC